MSPRPKLSVVVTCYDLGAYLQEALDSIPAPPPGQVYEVIVVDDGSKDPETQRIVRALDHSRYTVIQQVNMGLGKARNNGIAASSGEYIIPLDADNRLDAEGVHVAIDLLDGDPDVDIVYGDANRFGARTDPWVVAEFDFRRLLRKNYIDACACYRRSVWERLNGYDEHMPHMGWEDWDLWLRAAASGMRFSHIGRVFFDYRVREGSMIEGSNKNAAALTSYIFHKPSLSFLGHLRQDYMAMRDHDHAYLGVGGALRLAIRRLVGR